MSRTKKVSESAESVTATVAKPITAVISHETGTESVPESMTETAAETTVPPEETAGQQETEKQEPPEDVVYLGPNINDINISYGRVFAGGVIPGFLEERIKEVPSIKGLIVPVSRYAEVAQAVTLPDGRFSMLYKLTYTAVKNK